MSTALAFETLALLRRSLAAAKASKHPTALREAQVEIALSYIVGAVGGYEAERQLAMLLGWERVYEIGTPAHQVPPTATPVQTPALSADPALLQALTGLLNAREAARRLAALLARPSPTCWSDDEAEQFVLLSQFMQDEAPKRWLAARQLVAELNRRPA